MRNLMLLVSIVIFVTGCTPTGQPTAVPAGDSIQLPTPTPAASVPAEPAPTTPAPTAAPPAVPSKAPDLSALSLKLEPVIEGLDQPLFLTHAGDSSGRLFIVEKPGRIRIWQDGALLPVPFLDISNQVSLGNEQGLLGLAFPPNYATSGHFFVNYTDVAGDTHLARFAVAADDPNRADAASETLVLKLDQPAANHNGGMLAFGPDGMLWIGTGDGGAANDIFGNAQNPDALLGKMLRIDVTSAPEQAYTVPADNPWVTATLNGQSVRPEIWAVGLRNPWRYSFDRLTGDFWIGDVGQNELEEVDFTPAGSPGGLNYGWSIMEGKSCFQAAQCDQTGLVLPVVDYPHDGHCSISGGYVYRGAQIPAWDGVYFYADYCSGTIWALAPDGQGGWNNVELARSGLNVSSFAEDAAGELYLMDLSGGTVYQLRQADQP